MAVFANAKKEDIKMNTTIAQNHINAVSIDKTKRQITIAAYSLIAVCLILAATFPVTHALFDSTLGKLYAGWAGLRAGTVMQTYFAKNNAMYAFCVGTYNIGSNTASLPEAITVLYGTVYDSFKAIGFFLAMSVALGRLFQKFEKGQEGTQIVLYSLMSICVTGLIIMNLDKITGLIAEFGRQIIILFTPKSTKEEIATFIKALLKGYTGSEEGAEWWNLKGAITFVVPGIANVVAYYTVQIVIITKFMEIAILRMFAPLAVYDVYDEGLRSSGAMYLKRLLAAFISLAMCAFIGSMTEYMTSLLTSQANIGSLGDAGQALENLANGSGGITELITSSIPFIPTMTNFALVKMMKSTDEYAKAVVGVR